MRIRFLCGMFIILGVIGAGAAEARDSKPAATFEYTLETLRQSVADLAKENQAINNENIGMRARLKELNEQMRTLELESSRLQDKKLVEIERGKRRNSGAEGLKVKLDQTDEGLKSVEAEVIVQQTLFKGIEEAERSFRQQADMLSAEIAAVDAGAGLSGGQAEELMMLRQERDKFQRDFYAVTEEFLVAKKEWQDVNALLTTGPKQLEILKAEQADLRKSLAQAQDDLAGIDARLAEAQAAFYKLTGEDRSDIRIGRLESETRDMAERDRKLQVEMLALQRTTEEKTRRSTQERAAAFKQYELRQQELSQRNKDLRQELDILRREMVSLDKKKALLETGLYQAP